LLQNNKNVIYDGQQGIMIDTIEDEETNNLEKIKMQYFSNMKQKNEDNYKTQKNTCSSPTGE
jgi:hypothetical protein